MGGAKPTITIDFDEKNDFLLDVILQYPHRAATRGLALTANDLREKVLLDLQPIFADAISDDGYNALD